MKQRKMIYWKRGERAKLAAAARMTQPNLYQLLERKHGTPFKTAVKLERAAKRALGKDISLVHWLTNVISEHPAFYGKKARIHP